MKFIIATSELQAILLRMQFIVSQKAAVPLLANILVEAADGEITLTATDLTVGIRCFCEAKILEKGATTLPARHFIQLIRELTAQHVEISTGDHEVTEVIAGSSKFKVLGMSRNEYPDLPDLKDATKVTLPQNALKNVFFHTAFSVSREDNRHYLTGVFMHIAEGKATFIGTDGRRLAKTYLKTNLDPSLKGEYIIPLKAVEEILKILEDKEDDATVYLLNDKIAVEANDCLLIAKLLSGEYPDVNRVIPKSQQAHLKIHREELCALLRQISLFTTEKDQSVCFSFRTGELKLAANTMQLGEGLVSMPVDYSGENIDIAFNPLLFLDILRHSKGETVNMGLTDAFNPGTITENSEESPLFVIMPMRLK